MTVDEFDEKLKELLKEMAKEYVMIDYIKVDYEELLGANPVIMRVEYEVCKR